MKRAQAEVDKVHRAQEALSRITGTVGGRTFYLAVHRRTGSGQWSLRWRAMGVQGGHIAWSEIEDRFAPLPAQLKGWYRQINARAIALNNAEQLARTVLRNASSEARRNARAGRAPDWRNRQ